MVLLAVRLLKSLLLIGQSASIVASISTTFTLDTTRVVQTVPERFLSVTMDGGVTDFSLWQYQALASALSPAYLRLGGDSANSRGYKGFGNGGMRLKPKPEPPFPLPKHVNKSTITKTDFDELANFSRSVGWNMVFGLNAYFRTSDWNWDAKSPMGSSSDLIAYVANHNNMNGTVAAFELGNEPDLAHYAYNVSLPPGIFPVSPEQYAKDFQALRTLIREAYAGSKVSSPFVVGPSVANSGSTGGALFWSEFFGNASSNVVDVASWHHYYGNSKTATLDSARNYKTLDSFISQQSSMAKKLAATAAATTPLWVDETSSFYGGGANNISDRFVSGFTWLDKLGVAARLGVHAVCRQAWRGGYYSLLDSCNNSLCPTPDYFLSVLHKRLMGTQVLDIMGSLNYGREVRMWAHCSPTGSVNGAAQAYPAGSVSLMMLNTLNQTVEVTLSQQSLLSGGWDEFLLTPGTSEGPSSAKIALNGHTLELSSENKLPAMSPRHISNRSVLRLEPISYGFFVLHSANVAACQGTSYV